ncbi:LCP family protein [Nocardioides bigeumensis]|uniref:LCP family protein n=2 Tax=Nocardioides bigeumensis TaxID=433657 RepID=A0ABP5KHS1_9ACTN
MDVTPMSTDVHTTGAPCMSDSPAAPGDGTTDASAADASDGRPKRRGKVKKKHTVLKVVAASVVLLGMVTGLAVTYAYRHLSGNITTADITDAFVEEPPAKEEVEGPKEPLNILVMGSDTRDCDGCAIDNEAGGNASDTTILVHLSADRKRAYGISIPRDSLVTRPDCKKPDGTVVPGGTDQMWNAAFGLAGPGCTVSQFMEETGIFVDHYVVLNFVGFQDMVDAVGGVEVCIPETVDDRAHGIYLPAGTREISGKQALSYVRQRYAVGDGSDIGRLKRQQAFMASMANKVVSAGTLANPVRLFNFLDAATKSLTVDKGLGNLSKLAKLGLEFKDIGLDKIQFMTIPSDYAPDDPNRIRWLPAADDVWKRILKDQPLSRGQSSQAISAGNVPSQGSGSSGSSGAGSDSPSSASGSPQSEDAAEAAREAGLCA